MRARATQAKHVQTEHTEHEVFTLHMDYYLYSKSEDDNPNLQVVDGRSGMSWSTTVPFAVQFVMGCLNDVGYRRVILKSDDERAIVALKQKVKEQAVGIEITLQESPTGDHAANGRAEVPVREQKRQVRALKSELDECLGRIPDTHPNVSLGVKTCRVLFESLFHRR